MIELGEKFGSNKLSSAIKFQEEDGASQGSQQRYKLPILSKAAPAVFKQSSLRRERAISCTETDYSLQNIDRTTTRKSTRANISTEI